MSLCFRAARFSRGERSASFTGVTIDQCLPTGQNWTLHQPSLSDFSEPPGIQIVVKRCPLWQRTSVLRPNR